MGETRAAVVVLEGLILAGIPCAIIRFHRHAPRGHDIDNSEDIPTLSGVMNQERNSKERG